MKRKSQIYPPRKRFMPDEYRGEIMRMASLGMGIKEIAYVVDVNPRTIDRWVALPQIQSWYKKGRCMGYDRATTALKDLVDKREPSAVYFYLKTQWQWNEVQKVEHSGEVRSGFGTSEGGSEDKQRIKELERELWEEVEASKKSR